MQNSCSLVLIDADSGLLLAEGFLFSKLVTKCIFLKIDHWIQKLFIHKHNLCCL